MKSTAISVMRDLVASLSYSEPVKSITSAGVVSGFESFVIEMCNTRHLLTGCTIELDAKNYRITSVDVDNSITIKERVAGSGAPSITAVPIESPKFFHGTRLKVAEQLHKLQYTAEKYPMVYLYSQFSIAQDHDPETNTPLTPNYTLFLLGQSNYEDWNPDQAQELLVDPMDNLADQIIEAIQPGTAVFGKLTNSTRIYWPLAGRADAEGVKESIWADIVGGVELRISIPLKSVCIQC